MAYAKISAERMIAMFTGFMPETVDFLWGIRLNNRRDWFMEHKADYQTYLYEPMKALSQEIFAQFRDVPNMDYKLSRIYKDARMHPPTPYKESLWLSMRPADLPWSEQPTLYFEIAPEGCSYGYVLWSPKKEAMERYRQLLADKPAEFPALVRRVEKASGTAFLGASYYRKKPCPDPQLEPYYNLKNLQFVKSIEPGKAMFSGELAKDVIQTLKNLYPIYEYCLKFTTL